MSYSAPGIETRIWSVAARLINHLPATFVQEKGEEFLRLTVKGVEPAPHIEHDLIAKYAVERLAAATGTPMTTWFDTIPGKPIANHYFVFFADDQKVKLERTNEEQTKALLKDAALIVAPESLKPDLEALIGPSYNVVFSNSSTPAPARRSTPRP